MGPEVPCLFAGCVWRYYPFIAKVWLSGKTTAETDPVFMFYSHQGEFRGLECRSLQNVETKSKHFYTAYANADTLKEHYSITIVFKIHLNLTSNLPVKNDEKI
jgi:hypothetical protein